MKLELDDREVDYIANVLGQRPWAEVNPLLQKIVAQANSPENRPAVVLPVAAKPRRSRKAPAAPPAEST